MKSSISEQNNIKLGKNKKEKVVVNAIGYDIRHGNKKI